MAMEMTPLKAVVEPMLIRASKQAARLVKRTAYTGICVLGLTCLVGVRDVFLCFAFNDVLFSFWWNH